MKVSREQAAENRARIVEVAAKLFRERGFDGIGVADLMKQAGLTHGGFYGHFGSKDDLAAEACGRALEKSIEKWDRLAGEYPADPLGAIAESYLREVHLQKPGSGCLIAALGPDVARQEKPVRRAFTDGLQRMMARLSAWVPGRSKEARRQAALASFATMVGAVVMARAVDDRDFAEEILQAAGASLPKRGH
jgi:TetR/AcrR family transcriptional repressor of nem operon